MLRLRDIMTTNVVTVTPETTVREAMELLSHRHVSGAPVVAGSKLAGVVTSTDLMAFAASLSGVPTEREAQQIWDDPSVDDEVERAVETSSATFNAMWDDADAETTSRIETSATPEWSVLDEHDVSELMTRTPLCTLGPDASVESAAELMRLNGIHRVLVTNGDKILGIVSALDVASAVARHRISC
jgi:CBS domain-containing protein